MSACGPTVLIVDDDELVRGACARILGDCYRVLEADCGESALARMERTLPDVVLLDWHMPGISGRGLLQVIGIRFPQVPVVVITAYSDEAKAISAVEHAQGYLKKPFSLEVLKETIARVLEKAWRRHAEGAGDGHACGDIAVSHVRCEVRIREGRPVALTATEYAVLNTLLARAGQVVAYRDLARAIVSREVGTRHEAAEICKHHVSSLRRKIEPEPARPRYIRTVYRRGYLVLPQGDDAP